MSAPAPTRTRRHPPLVIVNTGHGKEESTAGFGMVLRDGARGYRVDVYRFVKYPFDEGVRAQQGIEW